MWTPSRSQITVIGVGVVVWMATIILSGLGFSVFDAKWDFTNPGAFGDSFGPLSAVMASIAALSAIGAYRSQQTEIQRQKAREAEDDKRARKSEFEATFFRLLEAFRNIVSETDTHSSSGGPSKQARDAFKTMLSRYRREADRLSNKGEAWKRTYGYYRNDLGHYFRFLYHVVRFVDRAAGIEKYFYARLVRALLSESELTLVALNCAYGEGEEKFKPLIERYALLHNLSDEARQKWQLDTSFTPEAFALKEA